MKKNQIKYIVVVPHSKLIKDKSISSELKVAILDYVDNVEFDSNKSKWVDPSVGIAARNWTRNNIGKNGYLMNYYEWRVKNPNLMKGCKAGGSWIIGDTLVISGQYFNDPFTTISTNEIPTLNKPSTMVKYSAKLKK